MNQQIMMVLVSIFSSVIFLVSFFFYHHFFSKRKINYLLLIFLLSLLPCLSIFRTGVYESGDFIIHSIRSIEFYRSLTEGNILPSWAANLNATFGYPLFIFNYSLPYYIISLFHFLGFDFVMSMKLFLTVSFLLSGVFMYLCGQKLFKNNLAAFVAAVFYQFAPYHLIDLHFKIVVGELMIFTLLPLCFFSLQKLWETKKILWVASASLFIALLIMSHIVIAFYSLILFACYFFFVALKKKNNKRLFLIFVSLFVASLACLYIWMTPFFMAKYTIIEKANSFSGFPQLVELIFSPWRFGFLFQGSHGELSFLLGYTHLLVIITALVLLLKRKINNKYKSYIIFWLSAFFILIFFISSYSSILWTFIPFLKSTGGSHRMLLVVAFVIPILAGYLSIFFIKKKILIWTIIFITIFSTILNWGHRHMIPGITDKTLGEMVWSSTANYEGHWYANSKWRTLENPWFTQLPKNHLFTTSNSATIQEIKRTTTLHTYVVFNPSNAIFKENTLYFPGWKVFDNNKLLTTNPDDQGLISFKLKPGLHYIQVQYQDLFILQLLKTISLTGIVILIGCILYQLVRKT